MLKCTKCGEFFQTSKFIKDPRYTRGFGSYCSQCRSNSGKNPELQQKRAYYNRLKRYGITEDEHKVLQEKHQGICAICGQQAKLVIDHNHITNNVRGLLCHYCNVLLGMAKDDVNILVKAISYLEEN
jgi:DNA-directed RNA polymerase subunit RPC12/RpoP